MVKRFTITLSDYIAEAHLASFKGNRSRFIEEMFIKGLEVTSGDLQSKLQEIIQLKIALRNLETENSNLKRKLNKFNEDKQKKREEMLEQERKENVLKGLIKSGFLHDKVGDF